MKLRRLLLILAGLLGSVVTAHAQFIWTGLGTNHNVTTSGNWQGGSVPPSDGTATILLGYGLNTKLSLSSDLNLDSVILTGNDDYSIHASSAVTLTLNGGLVVSGSIDGNQLWISPNITLNLVGAQTFDAGNGRIEVNGAITGTSPVTLISSSSSGGVFVFSNTGAVNSYSGGTTLGNGADSVTVAFWNSSPFGTGSVNLITGSTASDQLIAHGTQTVANALTFTGLGTNQFKSWDAPLTFSGAVTLASNTNFNAMISQKAIPAPSQDGSFALPGPNSRNPIVFSGAISGAHSLTTNGSGVLVLTGTNSYSGGTTINSAVVFGSSSSLPNTVLGVVNSSGYAGDATSGDFTTFLSHLNGSSSSGAVGLDTLPGNATATFTDALNLTGLNTSLRIGTATSAILTGTITPQATSNYQFGNGGGTLYVQSNLTLPKGVSLQNGNTSVPLTLYLQGSNTYNGATFVTNGFLIFDSAGAISPNTTTLTAAGANTNVGASYIGYTDVAGVSSVASFLGKFTAPSNTWGIIGFDTHAGDSTISVSNINLTGFNDGVFIGTTTSANIDASTLTGTTAANTYNAANTLRFTAAEGGTLTVNGNIANNGSPVAVMLGSPSINGVYSSGTVVMNGSSTYTGGTTLNAFNTSGLTLALGNSSALGTGTLTVQSNNGGLAGLQATSGGINLPNAIYLYNTGTPTTTTGPQLYLTGTNNFTVSGNLSGDITTGLLLTNSGLTASLSGNNSNFLGTIEIVNGALDFLSDHAPGQGNLVFASDSTGTATFSSANPTLYGISGDNGTLVIPGGTNLTFDVSNDNNSSKFNGVITGSGSVTVIAPTATNTNALYLGGNNTYTGGTTVSGPYAVLALGSNTAVGTGPVTVNTPNGGLILNSGVTFTNSLTYSAGGLGGFGTFDPSNLTNITFGSGQLVVGGLGGLSNNGPVGTLNFNTNVTFANGGTYLWTLQDTTRSDGMSLLNISGNLNITASAGGFNLEVITFDSTGNEGLANLTVGTPYSIRILHAGSITGFSSSAFTINASQFQNGTLSPTVFTLTEQNGQDLYLNFTPVPEPSTYALLGLGAVLLPALRRRRSLKS